MAGFLWKCIRTVCRPTNDIIVEKRILFASLVFRRKGDFIVSPIDAFTNTFSVSLFKYANNHLQVTNDYSHIAHHSTSTTAKTILNSGRIKSRWEASVGWLIVNRLRVMLLSTCTHVSCTRIVLYIILYTVDVSKTIWCHFIPPRMTALTILNWSDTFVWLTDCERLCELCVHAMHTQNMCPLLLFRQRKEKKN